MEHTNTQTLQYYKGHTGKIVCVQLFRRCLPPAFVACVQTPPLPFQKKGIFREGRGGGGLYTG